MEVLYYISGHSLKYLDDFCTDMWSFVLICNIALCPARGLSSGHVADGWGEISVASSKSVSRERKS